MISPTRVLRYLAVTALLAAVGMAFGWGAYHLGINPDITAALPESDPVVKAASELLKHHPALENVFVDISLRGENPDRDILCDAGDAVSAELMRSGLVKPITGKAGAETVAAQLELVMRNLSFFFSREDLEKHVAPLIHPERIEEMLKERREALFSLDSVGQARYLAEDPLDLRQLPLKRIYSAMPYQDATLYRGHIMSSDARHLLIVAEPSGNPQDSDFGRRLVGVLEKARGLLEMADGDGDEKLKMVYVGAFRAALDNETVIRKDTSRALVLVTIGLVLLLMLCFRRFWIGLLAAAPALAGIMLATFSYALLKDSIFALSLGFGGALISIAVDHGLTYALILDRPHETHAAEVSRDVWAVASVTVLTTVAALLSLMATGIPLFAEVGLFAALGVSLAALFTHLFFPLLLPRLKGRRKAVRMPLEQFADFLDRSSSWTVLSLLVGFALVMSLFVRFEFSADLSHMNTLRPETLAAEKTLDEAWGHPSGQAYVMATGKTFDELVCAMEKLSEFLGRGQASGVVASGPSMSGALPGPVAQSEGIAAWKAFWTPERITKLEKDLDRIGSKLGFKAGAFTPFFAKIRSADRGTFGMSPEGMRSFGVFRDREEGQWVFVEPVQPGSSYHAAGFFEQAKQNGFHYFDPGYFSRHLAGRLYASFLKMLIIIGGSAVLMLFLLIADGTLVAVAVLPLAFSLTATLGTLGLLNQPLSIASLMLAPILVGLGMDYGVYMVRSCQRYGINSPENTGPYRLAILMGGLSTLAGTGALALSDHAVLRSAGLSTFLGIFYAMAATFGILPVLLQLICRPIPFPHKPPVPGSKEHTRLTLQRFRHMEACPRFFAKFKIMLDPMFPRLADFVQPEWRLLDIGCGYGVPGTWLVVANPNLQITACDPDRERVRVAARALGGKAMVRNCGALDLLGEAGPADAVLLLDMLHYFSDRDLAKLLAGLATLSPHDIKLIIRVTVPGNRLPFQRALEMVKMRIKGLKPWFRSAEQMKEILGRTGYTVETCEPTAPGREETWFIALHQPQHQ